MIALVLALVLVAEPSAVQERDGRPCAPRSETCGVWVPEASYRVLARALRREVLLEAEASALRAEALSCYLAVQSSTAAAALERRRADLALALPPPAEIALPWWVAPLAGGLGLALGYAAGAASGPSIAVVR